MTPKYAEWRERHARSDAACRSFIRQKLGIKPTNQSEFATRVVDEWMVGYLSALLNWQAPEQSPETRPAQLSDATEILDLEKRS